MVLYEIFTIGRCSAVCKLVFAKKEPVSIQCLQFLGSHDKGPSRCIVDFSSNYLKKKCFRITHSLKMEGCCVSVSSFKM